MKTTINSSKFCSSKFLTCSIRQISSDFSTIKVLHYMVLIIINLATAGQQTSINSKLLHAGLCNNFTKILLFHENFIPKIHFHKISGNSRIFFTTKIWSHMVARYPDYRYTSNGSVFSFINIYTYAYKMLCHLQKLNNIRK